MAVVRPTPRPTRSARRASTAVATVLLLALATFPAAGPAGGTPAASHQTPPGGPWPDAVTANEMIGRGVNVVVPWSYLPAGWAAMTAAESAPVARAGGFDSVRLFVGFGITAGGPPTYALDAAFMADVRSTIEPFLAEGLAVVLTFDGTIGSVERFTALWRNIADELADLPPNVFFELANEPLWQHTPGQPPDFSTANVIGAADWNALVAAAIPAIRSTNPERTVIVTSSNISFPQFMPLLEVPPDDGHLIATLHQYQPLDVTGHLGPNPPPWSATPEQLAAMQLTMDGAVCWSRATGVPLVMSEFGISLPADASSRFAWTRAAAGLAEAEDISWQFFVLAGGNMAVYDHVGDAFVPELHDALFPGPTAPTYGPWSSCPAVEPVAPTTASTTAPGATAAPAATPARPRFTG